jgi:hypothetical protein
MRRKDHFHVPLASILARQLGGFGRPNNKGWYQCLCPAHGDASPSLSLRSCWRGRLICECFDRCSKREIEAAVSAVRAGAPLPMASPTPMCPTTPASSPPNSTPIALRTSLATSPIEDTVADTYLRQPRGITSALPAAARARPGSADPAAGRQPAVSNPLAHMVSRGWFPTRRANPRSTLPGLLTVELPSRLTICDISTLSTGSRHWVQVPARLRLDPKTNHPVRGPYCWELVTEFRDLDTRRRFSAEAVGALLRAYPDAPSQAFQPAFDTS